MKYGLYILFITTALFLFELSTGFVAEAVGLQKNGLTKSILKAGKLNITVMPSSGLSGTTATVTVTGATPNGKTVRISIHGSGHSYNSDNNGKVVSQEVISGFEGEKVKITVEDLSAGTYPPYPKAETIFTITKVKKVNPKYRPY
jgi:uncharacterized protein YjdB